MKKILWFLAGVIIIVFGFMGESYLLQGGGTSNYAGEIFGRKVSLEEYQRHFKQTQIQAMIQYGENFNKIREFLDFESETWDRMILLHEAKKRRIKISNEEVIDAIQKYGFFKRDGEFDKLLYNDVVKFVFRVTPRGFEEGLRESLKYSKLFTQETANINMDEEEIFNAYKKNNEKVQVSYVLFNAENFKDMVPLNEAKVQEYYQAHKSDFMMPLMVNVEYFRFDFPQDAQDTVRESALEQAINVADDLSENPDFEAAAQKNNIEIHTTGFFSQTKPNLSSGWTFPIIQKVFTLAVNQIEGPIETIDGYQILKIKEKKESYIPRYDEVKEAAQEKWVHLEAKKLARERALEQLTHVNTAYESVKLPDFAGIAKKLGLELHQTPVFNRGQYLPIIGVSKDFQDTSFQLSKDNAVSNVVEIEKGYCILHLDSIIPIDTNDYDKKKEELQKSLLVEKRNSAFTEFLTYLRLKSNLKSNLEQRNGSPN